MGGLETQTGYFPRITGNRLGNETGVGERMAVFTPDVASRLGGGRMIMLTLIVCSLSRIDGWTPRRSAVL